MIKQILLATSLIVAPVAAFTGFEVYAKSQSGATTTLGDLSAFTAIIADVQAIVAKGDLVGAAKRITDYETAWDEAETALRPMNPTDWGNIDQASDAALKAVRASAPSADKVTKTLASLMAALNDPTQPAQ